MGPAHHKSIPVCSFISGTIIVILALAQILMILMAHWPASQILWFAYLEFVINLDLTYNMFEKLFPDSSSAEYFAFLGVFLAITLCGWYFRIRIFQGLVFHYALLIAALILIDSYINLSGAQTGWPVGAVVVFGAALAAAALLAHGCFRVHLRYIAVFRA